MTEKKGPEIHAVDFADTILLIEVKDADGNEVGKNYFPDPRSTDNKISPHLFSEAGEFYAC